MIAELNAAPASRTDPARLAQLIATHIMPHVDIEAVSRLTLGKYWRQASARQKSSYERELHSLLIRTYSASVSRYRDQGIEFLSTSESENGRTSTVRTRIVEKGSPPIAVDYNLRQTGGNWKIYDVRIEGISLVLSFRTTFAELIRDGDLDSLIEQLATRNAASGIDDAFVTKALDPL